MELSSVNNSAMKLYTIHLLLKSQNAVSCIVFTFGKTVPSFFSNTRKIYRFKKRGLVDNSLNIDSEIIDFKKRPILNPREEAIQRTFNLGNKFKINGIEIEMIPVDHSVPGACGMIIYASDKTIA